MKKITTLLVALSATFAWAQTAAPVAAPVTPAAPAAAAAPASAVASVDATTGKAAWYGKKFNGRKTASGQRYNAGLMTAASKTLPFGTLVRVTNLKNKKSVVVRINDRGPSQPDRIIDVSRAAAARLGMLRAGVVEVELKVVGQSKGKMMKRAKKKAA
jgi:rare lipoprotein A